MALRLRDITHLTTLRRPLDTPRQTRLASQVETAFDCFIPAEERHFAIRLWDGSYLPPRHQPAEWTLTLNNPAVLRTAFLHPSDLALGEAFLRGEWHVEGDLERVFTLAEAIGHYHARPRDLLRLMPLLYTSARAHTTGEDRARARRAPLADGAAHTPERDRAAIHYHYDVGNQFYALWLDQRMVYSCAYFQTGDEDLDRAQEAKLDLICRKLRLQPGERFLDIGCGWGALIIHAARHYGVNATGITLSEEQAALARTRIAEAGLGDRCQVEVRDYRDLPAAWFNKIASVGMAEHVGRAQMPRYFATVFRTLKPGGLFLNHAIAEQPAPAGRPHNAVPNQGENSFIERYVFPDGELLPVSDTLAAAEHSGFEVCDVESLRRHYALTLRHWVRRLEARQREALGLVDDVTYRVWRLYMAGAAHSFTVGHKNIFQALLVRPGAQGSTALPLTRDDLYR